MDAVLPAIFHRGEGRHPAPVQGVALDVITGCIFTDVVAWFIIVACAATLYVHGYRDIKDAADAAQALRPLAGDYAYILVCRGLVQRLAVRRVDSAALDGVHRVRRAGFRIRSREEVRRGAGLLLALHVPDSWPERAVMLIRTFRW